MTFCVKTIYLSGDSERKNPRINYSTRGTSKGENKLTEMYDPEFFERKIKKNWTFEMKKNLDAEQTKKSYSDLHSSKSLNSGNEAGQKILRLKVI